MPIVIPTYGRTNRQKTWGNLPASVRPYTYLVVQEREKEKYTNHKGNVVVLPFHIQDIASTRDYIVGMWPNDKLIMIDDDLEFAVRREPPNDGKFFDANEYDIERMVQELYASLTTYAHGGISPREGANRNTEQYLYNGRAMRVLAYDTAVLTKHSIKFAPYTFMCDFGVTLELLTRGYDNFLLNYYVNNQAGSDTSGGCSTQRTKDTQAQAAMYLCAAFPKFVDVVQKETKTSWGGGVRADVRIQWKRARESAESALLDGDQGGSTQE
jgi:hypothetical protein